MGLRRGVRLCLVGRGWKRILLYSVGCLIAVAVLSQFVIVMMYGAASCSNQESQRLLKLLCLAYKQGSVIGTLCADLCVQHRMTFIKCLNFKGGKIILLMNSGSTKVVLKTKEVVVPYSKTLRHVLGIPEGEDQQKVIYPEWETFRNMVIEELKITIGYTGSQKQNRNILRDIWGINPENYNSLSQNPELSKIATMDTIWSLVQQTEFMVMKLNQDWSFIPEILGTCGRFYAMEFVETSSLLERRILMKHDSPWLQRVDVSMQLLKLVQDMNSSLFAEPLHMCDVKLENFGISKSGQLKAIDVDMFFKERKMANEIMSVHNCSSHYDCDFFDCKGWCNVKTRDCLQTRVNNNLQSVCEKILVSTLRNGYNGLLQSPPLSISTGLSRVLNDCVHPANSLSSDVPGKAEKDLLEQLITLLKSTLQS
ncbi:divergent protein kinase domain 1C-like [Liolophura sinensis]|uniref:divergent protein kinase domain 1C-like n=1 Tax=Liolophura sinensis TaxID=3198878 RepID=UPI0031583A16